MHCLLVLLIISSSHGSMENDRNKIWYNKPATGWTEAMPIGNGRLGAVVYGGYKTETLMLCEETVWSGGPHDYTNVGSHKYLSQLRNLIFTEQYDAAATFGAKHMLGVPRKQKAYQPLGSLYLNFPGHESVTDYRRELDMADAIAKVSYRVGDAMFTREIFASNPDQVIAIRLSCDQPGKITFSANLDSLHPGYKIKAIGSDGIALLGQVDSIHFQSRIKVLSQGGTVEVEGDKVKVTNADAVVILNVSATNFVKYNDISADPEARCASYMKAAQKDDYDRIKSRHIADFRNMFDRVSIDLGAKASELDKTTDQLLSDVVKGQQSSLLEEQLFQFGRYMNISGARPGTQPLNLVGIWAVDGFYAPWGGKWTLNINAELNTWPVETTNLPECHEPLLALLEDLKVTGVKVAREHYNCRGFVAHHNTDLWRGAAPVDTSIHGLWAMGSAWLTRHIWEHYDFSRDLDYLAKAYPTMKEAALFYQDFLIEDPDGNLGSCPAIAFETDFTKADGTVGRLTYSPTMDNQILRDHFTNCIMAAEALGIDKDKRTEWATILSRLRPTQIDPVTGRIMGWAFRAEKDIKSGGQTPPLWGVSPGRQINVHDTPDLADAAIKYLKHHIPIIPSHESGGSWITGTRLNVWARLQRPEEAYGTVNKAMKDHLYPNLMMHFLNVKYFQIDGNMGTTAGITEMLMQSHRLNDKKQPIIDILPALPAAWPNGSIKGLRARGAFEVDLKWQSGKMKTVTIKSLKGTPLTLHYGSKTVKVETVAGTDYCFDGQLAQIKRTEPRGNSVRKIGSLGVAKRPLGRNR
jgi:alpha-L-fucosidase 2